MIYEISSLTAYPYSAVTFLEVTFSDGYSIVGTGAVVGRNDVLTATHMVYDPDHRGWASTVKVYPGADFNWVTGQLDAPYGSYDATNYYGWPAQTFADSSNTTMAASEVPYDVALISMTDAIGDKVGWFGMSAGYNTSQWAKEIGYPQGSTGMMYGNAWITHDLYYQKYRAVAGSGSDIMGEGSSGGPLYVESNGLPYIIGVKSSGSSTTSSWADIGFLFDRIQAEINSNDYLITSTSNQPVSNNIKAGTAGRDTFTETSSNDVFDGGAGIDTMVYSGSFASHTMTKSGSVCSIKDNLSTGGTDSLVNIERLKFSDKMIALDIDGNAGQAYRLYQAAFDRKPDAGGLGYWINAMDGGNTLEQVASGFLASMEFASLYGANPTTAQFVTKLYSNVLHRAPEQTGYDWWMNAIISGATSKVQALMGFSESNENQTAVIGVISNGIEYTPYAG